MLDIKVNKWILISSDLASGSLLIFAWSSKIKDIGVFICESRAGKLVSTMATIS